MILCVLLQWLLHAEQCCSSMHQRKLCPQLSLDKYLKGPQQQVGESISITQKIVNSQSCAVKKQSHSCSLSSLYLSIFLAVETKNTIKLHKQRIEEIHLQQNTRGTHLLSKLVIVLKQPCKMCVEKKLALFKLILNLFRVNFKAVHIVHTERLAFLMQWIQSFSHDMSILVSSRKKNCLMPVMVLSVDQI